MSAAPWVWHGVCEIVSAYEMRPLSSGCESNGEFAYSFFCPPNSKCLHRLRTTWCDCEHFAHLSLSTTFLVVFTFLWNTGLV